ncbi:flagellar biosynthesis anti-sigma factor FlgM [Pokkaliibacter sp. MBI-7]|uniref:flagellar biosynthesis anti-sigma factor FlgM n=1 Tax=Pokkaliibacter sp. MBI-7 TaxID=3040600 RepID=UPI00244BAA6C|nr:flagellar biosynthesis anti-sigma factor FlgM [Pokkaliibacter sp. MBI-7]MDH2431332.1 flagellar biosynthesis anti-sigma factor FlgM [Pokkaliibacter sp. MBI-7]
MSIDINGLGVNQASTSRIKSQSSTQQKSADVDNEGKSSSDKVELSSEAKSMQSIEDQVRQLPDVDQEKVDRIKSAIADGSYSVNSQSIANKMLDIDGMFG